MKKIILFIQEDNLNIIHNSRIICTKLKNIIKKGYIVDKEKFVEEFLKILKKEKIKSKLFNNNMIVVKNSYYDNYYLYYLESIFNELGFLNIIYIDIKELLPDEDATFIEINNSYMVINFDAGVYLDLDYFVDIPKIFNYFFRDFKDNIILFGISKNIPNINIKNKKVYYYENFEKYIPESLLKVNKYD